MNSKIKKNKTQNTCYFPLGCDYAQVFFNNCDDYFICDIGDVKPMLSNTTWTADIDGSRLNIVTMKDGKKEYFSRKLMNTPESMECDHINSETRDNRKVMLRNGTSLQNKVNTPKGIGKIQPLKSGKFTIVFPQDLPIDTTDMIFDSKEEAQKKRQQILNDIFGDWTYEHSQEYAKEHETNQFCELPFFYDSEGILDKICALSQKSVLRIALNNIIRNHRNGLISDEQKSELLVQLIEQYKKEYAV